VNPAVRMDWNAEMENVEEYLYPATVEEALQMLAAHHGRARIIAGGTDLIRNFQRGEHTADCLVDISRIPALRGVAEENGMIHIGAATTHAEIARSALIHEAAAVLAEGAAEVGSPQIRNVGTIGGNVINAQPAADTSLALLALDAEAEVVGPYGAHWLPLADLYAGPGTSRVDPTAELLCRFRFRALHGRVGSAYRRLNRRKTLALPSLCVAVVVHLRGSAFGRTAIAVGPVAAHPWRASAAEYWLRGTPANDTSIAHAADMARRAAQPRDSLLRGAQAYRKAMVAVLVRDTLQRALSAAQRGEP
jgi:CO/xanthine dehydrogenase FAD-binding subunit